MIGEESRSLEHSGECIVLDIESGLDGGDEGVEEEQAEEEQADGEASIDSHPPATSLVGPRIVGLHPL